MFFHWYFIPNYSMFVLTYTLRYTLQICLYSWTLYVIRNVFVAQLSGMSFTHLKAAIHVTVYLTGLPVQLIFILKLDRVCCTTIRLCPFTQLTLTGITVQVNLSGTPCMASFKLACSSSSKRQSGLPYRVKKL